MSGPDAGAPGEEEAPSDLAPADPGGRRLGVSSAWGLLGVALLFGFAVWRLGGRGVDAMLAGLGPWQWAALVVLTGLFVWGEGHRALQRKWVPFVVGRARRLGPGAHPLHRLLAPLYAMGLMGAPARIVFRAWTGVAAVILAVLLVHELPSPWRGIVDFAVAAALSWGLVALGRDAFTGGLHPGRGDR